jgi:hypothetical protein
MAIRVRKLARQLGRAPEDLLDLLKTLGLSQYNNANQMLPANAEDALRAAVRAVPASRPVRRAAPVRPPVSRSLPSLEQLAAEATPSVDLSARLAVERQALARLRTELEAATAQVHAERQSLEEARNALITEQGALDQERSRLRQALNDAEKPREDDRTFLAYMLHKRGLRGMDECERALAALAERRQLRPIIELLRCDRPDRVMSVLEQRLVLVGGSTPTGLPETLAAVTVASDRADVPGGQDLSRGLARFGEILMLHGLRRVTVVGGRPAWNKTLREGLDPRVTLRFLSNPADIDATGPLAPNDLCVAWGVDEPVPADKAGRGVLVHIDGDHLLSLLTGVEEFLRQSAA